MLLCLVQYLDLPCRFLDVKNDLRVRHGVKDLKPSLKNERLASEQGRFLFLIAFAKHKLGKRVLDFLFCFQILSFGQRDHLCPRSRFSFTALCIISLRPLSKLVTNNIPLHQLLLCGKLLKLKNPRHTILSQYTKLLTIS